MGVPQVLREPSRVQERRDDDSRYYAADADLSRAKRHGECAKRYDAEGHAGMADTERDLAFELLEPLLPFLQIDPEAKL